MEKQLIDVIDRKDLVVDLQELEGNRHLNELQKEAVRYALYLVEIKPAIAPESLRPVGQWIVKGNLGICSECEEYVVVKSNYCPNCGAKMEESK